MKHINEEKNFCIRLFPKGFNENSTFHGSQDNAYSRPRGNMWLPTLVSNFRGVGLLLEVN